MKFQILSLSGGGFLGLYSISIIEKIEREIGSPVAKCFDLIAGTSIGGIIALGIAAEIPASEIKEIFVGFGEKIFSDKKAPQTALPILIDNLRSLFKSKYDGKELKEILNKTLGNLKIEDLKHPVIVPAVNLTKGSTRIFKTPHHPDFRTDFRLSLTDVALATSAAPTFFPIAEVEEELFVDGGLFANSPDIIALHEAEHFLNKETRNIWLLSIGTTTSKFSFAHSVKRNLGSWGWIKGAKLAHAMIASQQTDVDFMVKHKLGKRYVRVDEILSKEQERSLGLDIANKDAQKTIMGLASASYQNLISDKHFREFLEHAAVRPRFFHGKNKGV